ncbi:hypothetical protein AQBE111736_06610 [Aquirufa beregesia]
MKSLLVQLQKSSKNGITIILLILIRFGFLSWEGISTFTL